MEAFIKFVLQRYHVTRTGSKKWNVKVELGHSGESHLRNS